MRWTMVKAIRKSELIEIEKYYTQLKEEQSRAAVEIQRRKDNGEPSWSGKSIAEYEEVLSGIRLAMRLLGFEFVYGDKNGHLCYQLKYNIEHDCVDGKPNLFGYTVAQCLKDRYDFYKHQYERYEENLMADNSEENRKVIVPAMDACESLANGAIGLLNECGLSKDFTAHE